MDSLFNAEAYGVELTYDQLISKGQCEYWKVLDNLKNVYTYIKDEQKGITATYESANNIKLNMDMKVGKSNSVKLFFVLKKQDLASDELLKLLINQVLKNQKFIKDKLVDMDKRLQVIEGRQIETRYYNQSP